MNLRARTKGLALFAGVFGVALAMTSWNPGVAAPPSHGSSSQTGSHSREHHSDLEIRRALSTLYAARHELHHAKHDFDGHREAALRSVDEAIKQCEVCLKTAHNGGGSSSHSSSSASHSGQHHGRLASGS